MVVRAVAPVWEGQRVRLAGADVSFVGGQRRGRAFGPASARNMELRSGRQAAVRECVHKRARASFRVFDIEIAYRRSTTRESICGFWVRLIAVPSLHVVRRWFGSENYLDCSAMVVDGCCGRGGLRWFRPSWPARSRRRWWLDRTARAWSVRAAGSEPVRAMMAARVLSRSECSGPKAWSPLPAESVVR